MTKGKTAILAYAGMITQVLDFQIRQVDMTGSGNLAYRTLVYSLRHTMEGYEDEMTYKGKWLTLFRRQSDGSWKVQLEIWNEDQSE